MTLCMKVRAGEGGIIAYLGSPEDWQLILSRATRVRRLSDAPMGPYSGLYQVVDSSDQCRQFLVQEPAPGAWAGDLSRPVQIGSTVRVREGESEESWRVVACEEADPMRRCISEDSPMGRSLLGHVAGDVVTVRGPEGLLVGQGGGGRLSGAPCCADERAQGRAPGGVRVLSILGVEP